MKATGKCPKCSSTRLIPKATVIDHGDHMSEQPLKVATYKNPDSFFKKKELNTTVYAWVCRDCGFLELYASYPEDLIQQ
jgi:predicted nucleic-acid-binding Zn-ribbon protein